ncbi:hypothetical protein [Gelidibacter salicanalis]|uniref:Uncharacterized protein n=1 Tax=Gelidibacter salicanalis TaxID=291193 RepID=A0A934KVX5_9FLAO|nr:hypothetical protein [Gelidibacter salicanalis]MBJ7881273.1 hypothetical protein [Gelidibacter salicanalis]
MHKSIICIALLSILLTSCGQDQDPFSIQKQNIGSLTDSTQIKDLKRIFENDSIVNYIGSDEFTRGINTIDIYDSKGSALLSMSPNKRADSTAIFSSVRILDPRFKTEEGISTASTFKDIQDAYEISKIDNLINSIVVSVDDINAAFTIDKQELPSNLRFDRNLNIEASQIPDNAKIKYFFIHWN